MNTNLKLYEIAAALENAIEIDEDTGEILPGSEERLEALELARDAKACDLACLILSVEAEETAIRAEAAKLTDRARTVAKRADWLRMYLAQWLPKGEKIADSRVSLRIGETSSVEIAEDADIPAEYMVPKFSPDKKAIKAVLESGTAVAGARVVTKRHVVIK